MSVTAAFVMMFITRPKAGHLREQGVKLGALKLSGRRPAQSSHPALVASKYQVSLRLLQSPALTKVLSGKKPSLCLRRSPLGEELAMLP